jgi:hypothetical protein
VLRKRYPQIRNHADKDETGTGVHFRQSHFATQHIRTAHIITQLHKIHSQLVGLATALMYQVTGLRAVLLTVLVSLQPDDVNHNRSASDSINWYFTTCDTSIRPQLPFGPLPYK